MSASHNQLDNPKIEEVYSQFGVLAVCSSDLGGWLLLYANLDSDGIATAMASNIAGAASLGLEPDAERAKAALRAGVCDFVVNNLDEALRILKNEIRQRRGVSVVLTAEPEAAVAEIVERGVQPEVLAFPVPELVKRGARLLSVDASDVRTPVRWSVERDIRAKWLPALDALAAESLEQKDARLRWIESGPRYLGRAFAGQRYVRMSEAEADRFVSAVQSVVKGSAASVSVTIVRGGEKVRIEP